MKILVYPHLTPGGDGHTSAVDLAAGVRDRGHEVAVFGPPGPLAAEVERRGLELIPAPDSPRRPAVGTMRLLAGVCRRRGIDLVHAYEWPAALESFYGPQLALGVPVLGTVLSLTAAPFLPPSMPLTVSTGESRVRIQRTRRAKVELLELPVDVHADHPGVDAGDFRGKHGIPADRPLVACVARLTSEGGDRPAANPRAATDAAPGAAADAAPEAPGRPHPEAETAPASEDPLPLLPAQATEVGQEELARVIAAAELLGAKDPVTLAVVGPATARLRALAAEVNATVGDGTVVLTGPLPDPRPAFAAADLLVGSGRATLRGAAFGKASIVVGEDGYSEVLGPEALHLFRWYGFYGVGDGDRGPDRLAGQIRQLLDNAERRAELGAYARRMVLESFSAATLAATCEGIYEKVLQEPPSRTQALAEGALSAVQLAGHKLRARRGAAAGDPAVRPRLEPPPAAIVLRESPH